MKAILTITPVSNVEDRRVVDDTKVTEIKRDWEDLVPIFDAKQNKLCKTQIKYISLYDHRIIVNDEHHHILHMFSKEA
jgi:hypothetical protein